MKIYYSKFAYTIMLVCSIIMLIALSAALYVLMFKIPNIEILPKILLVFLKFYKKRVKITASLKICYIKFYFATNIKLYFMKGDCNIIL